MDAIQQSFQQMMATFHQRLDTIEVQLPGTKSPYSSDSLTAEFTSFKAFVVATFRALQEQLAMLAQQIDHQEMRSRRKILLLHGLPEEQEEKTDELVSIVVSDRLKLANFTSSNITRCHRMGRAAEGKSRPVLFKLQDVNLRDRIWSAKSSLRSSGVTLSEFLTKTRHDLFMAARRRFGITKCWTREGSIFVLGPDGVRHRVNKMDDLASIQVKDPTAGAATTPTAGASTSTASKPLVTTSRIVATGVNAKESKGARPRRDNKAK